MWRWASGTPRLGPVDARAGIALLIWAFHWSLWTFAVAVGGLAFFYILERFGFTLPVAFRAARAAIAGPVVHNGNPATPIHRFYREYP